MTRSKLRTSSRITAEPDLAESCVAVSAGVCENGRPRRPSSAPGQPAGSFAAKTSTISILGVSANNRGAWAIRVRAMSPARCAWRAASPANASNIANVAGPMRSANQTGVVVSRFASATALSRNPFTSSSLPGFACKRTNSPTLTICPRFPEVADMPNHPREGPRAGCTDAPTPGFPPNSGSSGSVQWHFQSPLVEAGGDAAHDNRPGTAKRCTIGSSDVSVPRQLQNAELLGQKTAIALFNCILGPLIEVGVPHRAVVARDRGNAAERIVRPMPIQQGSGQALTLRIFAATFRCTVRRDKDPLDSTAGDVVDSDLEFAHARGEGVPLEGRNGRIARLGRDIQDRFAKAEPVDQRERNGPMRWINGDHLIMHESVVRLSTWEVDIGIVHCSGDDRRVVNDAVDPDQRAVVRIADRARLRSLRWERLILGAGHDHPVRAEVHDAGLEEKRPVGATCGGACSIAGVGQFLGEVYAQALRLSWVACIENDVPRGLQTRRRLHRALEKRQCDRSSGGAGGDVHTCQLLDR